MLYLRCWLHFTAGTTTFYSHIVLQKHTPGAEKAEVEQYGFCWCSLETRRTAQIYIWEGNYLNTSVFVCAEA